MVVVTINNSSYKYIFLIFALLLYNVDTSKKQNGMIYVLQYTYEPYDSWDTYWHFENGQEAFVSRNCSFQNCFLTPNRKYFNSTLDFDALVFAAELITSLRPYSGVPLQRSERQLYIFFSSEPPTLYPISNVYNNVFNVTWTYKLASDIFRSFFVVKNNIGEIKGPKVAVNWMDNNDLAPINSTIKQKLKSKHIAAAWVASHCGLGRNIFIQKLNDELSKYGHRVDFFGGCGNISCPKTADDRNHLLSKCYDKIESDYYFYLAFENTFAEDYVSEKVLHGLQHFTVPIVYGGADYTRFLPDGSYLDAVKLGEERLAKEMTDIINDPTRYHDFFKWHGYYSFQDTTDSDHRESVCAFCAFLNNQKLTNSVRIYHDICDWWNVKYPKSPKHNPVVPPSTEEYVDNQDNVSKFFSNVLDFFLGE